MKLCKDCKHYRDDNRQAMTPYCIHAPWLDLVSGETKFYSCSTERGYDVEGGCGRGAQYFEAKEPAEAT